ncbi:hypothetical protein PILCRDRAFT_161591 [Piloderma croceum F 1598]|uniref:Uncharacterized protein n=1 Tax=Piloderma croceum (strain F 1598) TaxID=765440 RepID=A0A0C3BWW8_PILCF|nr:hypothetical protein PILCRDRAFT_161591 [Piloderma croceum F 1598]
MYATSLFESGCQVRFLPSSYDEQRFIYILSFHSRSRLFSFELITGLFSFCTLDAVSPLHSSPRFSLVLDSFWYIWMNEMVWRILGQDSRRWWCFFCITRIAKLGWGWRREAVLP